MKLYNLTNYFFSKMKFIEFFLIFFKILSNLTPRIFFPCFKSYKNFTILLNKTIEDLFKFKILINLSFFRIYLNPNSLLENS